MALVESAGAGNIFHDSDANMAPASISPESSKVLNMPYFW
jgi:hypothetical protein